MLKYPARKFEKCHPSFCERYRNVELRGMGIDFMPHPGVEYSLVSLYVLSCVSLESVGAPVAVRATYGGCVPSFGQCQDVPTLEKCARRRSLQKRRLQRHVRSRRRRTSQGTGISITLPNKRSKNFDKRPNRRQKNSLMKKIALRTR